MIVVDLGCQDYGYQNSLGSLVDTYKPDMIFGFDPSVLLDETVTEVNGTPAKLERKAAWLFDGEVEFVNAVVPTSSKIAPGDGRVSCFDFSQWLAVNGGPDMVVKMDIEGAEYPLLWQMKEDGTDIIVAELLVEWHGTDAQTAAAVDDLRCPVKAWWM